jgi:hypothetical protein
MMFPLPDRTRSELLKQLTGFTSSHVSLVGRWARVHEATEGGLLSVALRMRLLMIVLFYTGSLIYAYIGYLSPIWGDLHYPKFNPSESSVALALSITAIGAFALTLPAKITTYSHFVAWFLFYFLFTPSVLYISLQGKESDGGISLISYLIASFAFISFIPSLFTSPKARKPPVLIEEMDARYGEVLHVPLLVIYIICLAGVFVVFVNMMRIASFFEVYEQREIASQISGNRTLIAYILEWIPRLMAPFMFAVGLFRRNRLYIVLALLGFGTAYAIGATKYVPALILLMFLLRHLVFATRDILPERMGLLVLGGIGIPLLVATLYGALIDDTLDMLLGQSLHRVFGTPGTMIGHYSHFFSVNSLTYYSHIGAFQWFLDYPYGENSVGQVIGHYLVEKLSYEANANFWAVDGIAALYHPGLLVIGIVLGGILSVFNMMSSPERVRLLCLSSVASVWMLVDGSLPRVLFSGGWALHFILIYFFFQIKTQRQDASERAGHDGNETRSVQF